MSSERRAPSAERRAPSAERWIPTRVTDVPILEVLCVLREDKTPDERESAAWTFREDGRSRAALRQWRTPRGAVPGRARARVVWDGLLLGRREEVLAAPRGVFHRRRLRGRLHAEP